MLLYNSDEKTVTKVLRFSPPKKNDIIWAHFTSLETEELNKLLDSLAVHPLAKKAMLFSSQSPRIDVYKNEAFISSVAIKENYECLRVNILVGKNYVITYLEQSNVSLFPQLLDDFREHPEHMSHTGHILYHILDKISMFYLKVVDQISNEIHLIEKRVFKKPFDNSIGKKIYTWKGKLYALRKVVEAHENVIKSIGRSDFPYINEDAGFYFQDLLDNFSRITEAFDTFKDDLSSIFDLQMSLKSDHLNAIMKVLTLVSVIFIPMTFIAGVYGMNFEYMPELKWKLGYFYALALMFGLGISIALYFRKKGWWGKEPKSAGLNNSKTS